MREVYGVFEGGGVRGTALVGAVAAAEKQIKFRAVAGTSAGAIVASLIAAGYNAEEMRQLLMDTDLRQFRDAFSTVPGIQHVRGLRALGWYKGEFFHNWMREKLSSKLFGTPNNTPTFEDLPIPLKVVAVDLVRQKYEVYDKVDYKKMSVADAVRRSMSIPFFFSRFGIWSK